MIQKYEQIIYHAIYLANIIDNTVITCDEIINITKTLATKRLQQVLMQKGNQ